MAAKRILVICGTGVATSTVVATRIKEHCAAQGLDVAVRQGKVMDIVGGGEVDADLIVATTAVPASVTTPSVNGLPFLTGMGVDATLATIVSKLRD